MPSTAIAATAVFTLTLAVVLVGMGQDRRGTDDGSGFRDGFVSGYGLECRLDSPRERARSRTADYVLAYADGLAVGRKACRSEAIGAPSPVVDLSVAQLAP